MSGEARLAPVRALVRRTLAHANTPAARRLRRVPLLGPALHALSHRVSPPGRREWVEVESGPGRGLRLLLDPRFDVRYWRGDAEPALQELLLELAPPGSVAWDVGAHVGFFTLLLARRVGDGGSVVAFEPDPWSRESLEAAVAAGGFGNVEVLAEAAWSTRTRLGFQPRAQSEEGFHGAVASDAATTVQTTTLDEVLAERRPPALVKIDVEGAEEHALLGARRLLAEVRPAIVCEVHELRRGSADLPARVRALLEEARYDVREVDPGTTPLHFLAVPCPEDAA
ncbi:MAG TPA: FkbM family methyltransferase [Gaiellaceae bacterium]|nr:FkbM family methyltransferase [Gaiellaceae bacterium]